MNYAGKFDGAISSDGPGNHSHFVHLNPGHIHAPADAIVVPDAHFLFNADFKRSGVDLVLSSDDHELVLHEYFKGEKHKALASPDGAHLTGELVDALTGHVELAQAGGAVAAASAVIGHITKMQGSATVIRNGVSIILNMGDNVEKGDVVQSGSNSSVGITFIDGTVFGLSSNAKMVLNEMVYDPNGSNNSSLISLVAGTITFVAGETAKRGDMKIDTPVATMGIRGTAVLVEIDFSVPGANGAPNASFQVLVEPDGTTGSYILFDKATMQPLAIVNQAGQQININNGVISQTQNPLTPQMQQLINEVFSQKFTDNSTTKTTSPTGSSTPDGTTALYKYAEAAQQQTTTQGIGNNQQDKPTAPGGPGGQPTQHVAGAPIASFTSVQLFFIERPGLTGSSALDQMKFTVGFSDPNPGDTPTVRADFTGFTLKDAAGHDVPLSPLAQQDVLAAEIDLNPALVAAAGNANNGSTDVLYSLVDKDFDFLAQGQSITLSYVITVNNNYGPAPEVTKQTVTFTIFGTNDVPVIADDKLTQLIEFKGGTSTPGGTLTVLNGEATGGTYDFKDPDLTDTHWIIDANKDPAINHTADPNASDRFNSVHKAALTSASLTLPDGTTLDKAGLEALAPGPMSVFEQALDVNVSTDSTGTGNGEISWQLENLPVFLADFIPVGETLKLYYTIEVTDENGATDTKVVEVDITGTNAAATVWVHTTDDGHDGNWTTGANWGTGKAPTSVDDVIIVTDQLHPHTPAYPATITTGTNAAANSVVMNDFVVDNTQPVPQTIPPELKLETGSSLTIGTSLVMSADSILTNAGTVNIGTQLELKDDATNPVTPVNESVINNSGTINIGQGGDIQGVASVTNSGTIDLKGGTLNLDVNIANSANGSGGDIIVESGAKLVLGGDVNTGKRGGVTGGTVTVNGGGELDLTGVNTLSSGTLSNTGQVNVSGLNNILSGETVSNTGTASAIDITGVLTAQAGTTIANQDATSGETIESGGSLTLKDTSSISGGQVTNAGTLNLQGTTASLSGGKLTNTHQVNVSGSNNALTAEQVLNTGTASAIDITGTLTAQTGTTIANQDATSGETIESGGTLTLKDTSSISGGQVTNAGTLNLQGTTASLSGGKLTNTHQVNVSGSNNALTAEQVLNTGTASAIDITGTLTAQTGTTIANQDATSGETVESGGTLTLKDTSSISGGQVTNAGTLNLQGTTASLSGGKLTNIHQVNVSGSNNALTAEQVLNTGTASAIDITGTLTAQTGTTIANQDATSGETVESGGTLTLKDTSSISGGQVTNKGTLVLSGTTASLSGGKLTNTGQVNVSGTNNALTGEQVFNTGMASAIDITGTLTAQTGTTIANQDTASGETIESGASLTLDDTSSISGGKVIDKGTLTLNGTSSLSNGILTNTAQVNAAGTNGLHNESISNSGAGAIDITGDLTLDLGTAITNGTGSGGSNAETIESGASLTLDDTSSISGGKVIDKGTLTLNGTSSLSNGILTNTAQVNAAGTNGLHNESVSNSGAGAIDITGDLTLDLGTAITNGTGSGGSNAETIESGASLTLDDTASISGGKVIDKGTLTLNGTSSLSNGILTNTAQVNAAGTNGLHNESVSNSGAGAIDITGDLTLDLGTAITNGTGSGGSNAETIESGASLTLDDTASISGGKVIDKGTLTLNGTSSLSNGILTNTAQVNAAGTNGLHNESVSNSGAGAIDITGDLTLDLGTAITNGTGSGGSNAETIESGASLTLDDTSSISGGKVIDKGTLTLNGTSSLSNGILTNTAQVNAAGTNGLHNESISNSGAGAIDITGDLTLDLGTAITNGTGSGGSNAETIESGASLTLDDTASISGGKVIDKGTLTLNGTSSLSNGILTNTAQVNAAGTNGLHNESVSNSGAGAIDITGDLTLDLGTAITNGTGSGGSNAETIESGASLTLDDTSSISGGKVIDKGTLTLNGTSSLSNGILTNTAQVNAAGTNGLHNESISNSGAGAIDITGDLTLDLGTAITNGTGSGGSNAETIESGASLTLDDTSSISGGKVIDKGTLTLNGTSSLSNGILTNTAQVNAAGTNGLHNESVSNSGAGAIDITGDLTLDLGTAITNGTGSGGSNAETIESGASLTLKDTSSISGGKVANAGTLNLQGTTASLSSGSLANTGTLNVSGSGNALHDETVTANNMLEVLTGAALTLDQGTSVANASGTIKVDASATLTLNDANITNGTVTNAGTIDSAGGGAINQANITNTGTIESTSGTLTIDPSGPSQTFTLTNSNMVKADGGQLYIIDEQVANTGTLEAINGGTLKLTGLTVTNTDGTHNGTVSVGNLSTLDLSDAHISGGSLSNAGTVYSTGISTIDAAITNDHSIEVGSGTLTLSGSISGGGSATIDGGATLDLASSFVDSQDVTFAGSGAELIIEGPAANGATSQNFTGDIHGFAVTDEIDLRGISYGNPTYASYTYDATTGVLTVNDGNGSHYDLDIGTGYAGAHFAGSDDTHGGTLITMTVDDHLPSFGQVSLTASLAEQADQTGSGAHDPVSPLTAGGTLNFTDVDLTDLPTVSIAPGGQSVSWTDTDGTTDLSASLSDTQKAALENALTLSAHNGNHNNGATDWNYSIADSALDFLGEGQTLTITTTVVLDDHQNTLPLPTEQITVTITGANDNPTITAGAQNVQLVEAGVGTAGTASASIALTKADPDATDAAVYDGTQLTAHGWATSDGGATYTEAGIYGTATLTTATGVVSYALNDADPDTNALPANAHVSDDFTVYVKDGFTGTASTAVDFSITGTNDNPTVTAGAQSAQLVEAGVGTAGTSSASIALTTADPDTGDAAVYDGAELTTHGWTTSNGGTTYTATGTYGTATLTSATGVVSYALNNADPDTNALPANAHVSDNFTVYVKDGSTGTASTAVNFAITGTDDAPVVAAVSKAVADTSGVDAGHVVASGTAGTGGTGVLAGASDPDTGDSLSVTQVNGSAGNVDADVAGTYGTLHLKGDGSYTYTANTAVDALQSGSNATDLFSFTVSDGHGGNVTQNLTFNITGTDDTPVLSVDTVQAAPSGWLFDSANGHYYRYVTASQITWNAANAAATADGGYLATITDASENTFVHNLVGSHNAWLGASDAGHEGTWAWVTGPESGTVFYIDSPQSFPGYSNWNGGEPNNEDHGRGSPHQENYLQILGSGKWNDEQGPSVSSADRTNGYVEEKGAPGVVLANFVEDTPTSIATAALLANDTDVDGGPLVVSAVDATSAHGGALTLQGGVITYTPSANFNGVDQFSYTVSDGHGGTATGSLSFAVAAVNDAPVLTGSANLAPVVENNVNPAGQTVSALFAGNFSDVDAGSSLAGVAVSADNATGSQGTWQYEVLGGQWQNIGSVDPQHALLLDANTLIRFVPAQGFTGTPGSLQVHAVDNSYNGTFTTSGHAATIDATLNGGSSPISTAAINLGETVTAAGTLAINEGPQTASVVDNGNWYATGQLTVSNPGTGDTWSIAGGQNYTASSNYQFGIDEFSVVKTNGNTPTTVFDDSFNGTVPPAGPAIQNASSPSGVSYNDFGTGTYVQGTGEALFEGSNAGYVGSALSSGSANYGKPVFGQFTTLLTGTGFNTSDPTDGLRSGQSFTASGTFDLVTPTDTVTRYGIRLSDRVSGAANPANDQPGTETIDVGIARNGNGQAVAVLTEYNFETGISTTLQSIVINNPHGDNEIVLSLSNDAANNGAIVASYQLENNGVADGAPVTFGAVGHIFDNENWTRAQFYTVSTATDPVASTQTDSVLQGTYGQLDLAQDGSWHYALNPGLASVKALADGQHAQDHFQVQVTNAAGQQSTQIINVDVAGTNDAPVATAPAQYTITAGTPLSLVNTGLSVSDPDDGGQNEIVTLSVSEGTITIAAGDSGVAVFDGTNGTGSVTFSGTISQINALLNHSTGTTGGTIVYTDNAATPGFFSAQTLKLTVDDNGSNGGSPLSDSASATINVAPAGGTLDWGREIDPFATATTATTTKWVIPNADGLTSTVFNVANGNSFTYDPTTGLPTGGVVGSIQLVDNPTGMNGGGHVLQTITYASGSNPQLGDFGNFIAREQAIEAKIPWAGVIETGETGPVSFTDTDIRIANSDGTFTEILGNNFAQSGDDTLTGTVTSVELFDSSNDLVRTVNFTGGTSLSDLASAVFPDNLSHQFYDLMAQGNTTVTGFKSAVASGAVNYFEINDTPGNHTYTSQNGATPVGVDFADATSGVTVNLANHTANWGGFTDVLNNISIVRGSNFVDTIVGNNAGNNFLDGGGATSGHDTLTAGSAHTTFVFQQGYGLLTITNFDQAGGSFNASENDIIQLNNLGNPLSVIYVADGNSTDAVLDFGHGDKITLLNVTQAQFESLNGSEFAGNNGGGGNNGGPVISNASNSVTYTGTPVTLDSSIHLADATATVSSVNTWISSGEQNGDQLTINGTTNGTITEQDGSVISYHFDATLNTGNDEGHGLFLQAGSGTPTTADFQAALELIQFAPGAADGDRTVTYAAQDANHQFSSTETTTVHVNPVLNISDGGDQTISGPSDDTVVFATGSGTLHLNQPSTFTGAIAGISGNGDVLDMHGFTAATTTATTGAGSFDSTTDTTTLTVHDSNGNLTETFKLVGNLSNSLWTVTTDNHGGVNIVDPPASSGQLLNGMIVNDPGPAASGQLLNGMIMNDPGPAASPTVTATAPNQTLAGSAASDNFAFNFKAVGSAILSDLHLGADSLQFAQSIFANAQAAFDALHDDGHGNTIIGIDAHDTITLGAVLKAQLHVGDFHVV